MDSSPESSGNETVIPSRYPLDARSFCVRELATDDDEIRELYRYLDMVKKMVRPGCPPEVLEVALDSVSSLFKCIKTMSSERRPHASL